MWTGTIFPFAITASAGNWDRAVGTAVALTALAIGPASAAGQMMLTPADIQATFATGKPFIATSLSGTAFTFTFTPDGKAVQAVSGRASTVNGAWRLSDTGYCTRWSEGMENCYTVEKSGSMYDVRDAAGHVVSRWTLTTTALQVAPLVAPIVPPSTQLLSSSSASLPAAPGLPPAPTAPAAVPKAALGQFRDGSFTGSPADAYYGTVQVRAVVTDGRLVSIDVLNYPSDRSTSRQINKYALPQLQREVVQAQGVRVRIVSGATLTTQAYLNSLRGALQQAQ